MLNYGNLNDVEFEYLCQDIMSRKLGVELQRFAPGRDGGIDLTDDTIKKNIVVQVKHYMKTDVSGLMKSLGKEVPKVKELNPRQYYVCCSKELSAGKKAEIRKLFSEYMESDDNVITLIEIDDFLSKEENSDILRKHFKLWIESANILENMLNGDILVDSESLLYDIEENQKFFVRTAAFDKGLECLEKNNVLMILGDPGIGKTITSEMLVLHYVGEGYKVRYTTDISNLSSLKKSLSQAADIKEVILLDDCFGQAYFDMKDTQSNELLRLIRWIRHHKNKILIMNSRITIYQEAKKGAQDFVKSFDRNEYKVYILDMTKISDVEKAKIFYNHLFFNEIPAEYYAEIVRGKRYRKIVSHTNYNPRIIEYVCQPSRVAMYKAGDYFDFIMESLNNPQEVWANEYERRLQKTDRIFLTTLFSLTKTMIPLEMLERCYNHRLNVTGIDDPLNQFRASQKRLTEGLIKVIDLNGEKMVSVANPSINDFIEKEIESNSSEKERILNTSFSIRQIIRLCDTETVDQKIQDIFNSKEVLSYAFLNKVDKSMTIAWYIGRYQILQIEYQPYIYQYIHNVYWRRDFIILAHNLEKRILEGLLTKEVFNFYNLSTVFNDEGTIENLLEQLEFTEFVDIMNQVVDLFEGERQTEFVNVFRETIPDLIKNRVYSIDAEEYAISPGKLSMEMEEEISKQDIIDAVEESARTAFEEEIYELAEKLCDKFKISLDAFDNLEIEVEGSEGIVDDYFRDEDYYYRDEGVPVISKDFSEIDYIFDR